MDQDDDSSQDTAAELYDNDDEDLCTTLDVKREPLQDLCSTLDVKREPLQMSRTSSPLHDMTRIRWPPGSWQDGTRRSAFQPYRPTTVLTNLQRGNIPTETLAPEQADVGLHHRAGQGEITEMDLQQEHDVDVVDSNGLSALMWASAYGQVPTVQLLLRHHAQVDREGCEGETPLLLAAAGGHHDVVRILLTEGAAVNHADEVGNTALMYAAYGDHPHCTNELLLRGADITMVNLNGDTAYGVAVCRGSKLGATVNAEHYVAETGKQRVIKAKHPGLLLGVSLLHSNADDLDTLLQFSTISHRKLSSNVAHLTSFLKAASS